MTLRRAQTATLSVMAGAFIVSSGVCGATIAEAHRYHLVSTTSTCANRPAAAARVVSDIATKPGASVASSASPNSGNASLTTTRTIAARRASCWMASAVSPPRAN